jgi:hypothetical protein
MFTILVVVVLLTVCFPKTPPFSWVALLIMGVIRPFQGLLELVFFVVSGTVFSLLTCAVFSTVVYLRSETVNATLLNPTVIQALSTFGISPLGEDALKWVSGMGTLLILFQISQHTIEAWTRYVEVKRESKQLYWFFYHFRDIFNFLGDLVGVAIKISLQYSVSIGLSFTVSLSCYWIILTYGCDIFFIRQMPLFEGVMAVGVVGAFIAIAPPFVEKTGWILFNPHNHQVMVDNKVQIYNALLEKERAGKRTV